MKAKFYEECDCGRPNRAFLCLECLGLAYCLMCHKTNLIHKHHRVIQTFRASHQPGIEREVIGQLIDVGDIQPYLINFKTIVYINKKNSKGLDSRSYKCRRCGCSVRYERNFCSIECKVKSKLELQEDVIAVGDEASSSNDKKKKTKRTFEESNAAFQAPPNSYRKRRRKWIPVRSPLM
ncbi:hypothetical protein ACOSQ3_023400 [Xanthoceras sorbifolium]